MPRAYACLNFSVKNDGWTGWTTDGQPCRVGYDNSKPLLKAECLTLSCRPFIHQDGFDGWSSIRQTSRLSCPNELANRQYLCAESTYRQDQEIFFGIQYAFTISYDRR